jgi:hypothetical protein
MRRPAPRLRLLFAVALGTAAAASSWAGCGYTLGYRARDGIESIAVPVFENRSLRRELELVLTELVVREIQQRTPLRVTSRERADAVLLGAILRVDEKVLVEDDDDNVLESSATVRVAVELVDRSGRRIFRYGDERPREGEPGPTGPALVETAEFVAAGGADSDDADARAGFGAGVSGPGITGAPVGASQSTLFGAEREAFENVAERIVFLLEEGF